MNGHEAAIGFDWGLGFTSFVSCFGGAEQNVQAFVLYGSRQTFEAFLRDWRWDKTGLKARQEVLLPNGL